jgi:hypothetical protein
MYPPEVKRFIASVQLGTYSQLGIQPRIYDASGVPMRAQVGSTADFKIGEEMAPRPKPASYNIFRRFTEVRDGGAPSTHNRLAGADDLAKRDLAKYGADPDVLAKMVADRPTEYTSPFAHKIATDLLKIMRDTLFVLSRSSGYQDMLVKYDNLKERLFVATIPSGQVNARIMKIPRSKFFCIAFDEQIFNFLLLVSKAYALAVPLVKEGVDLRPNEIDARLDQNPEAIARFDDLMLNYLGMGLVGGAAAFTMSDIRRTDVAEEVLVASELFLVGHEIGHVLAGDLDEEANFTHLAMPSMDSTLCVETDYTTEMRADLYGVMLSSFALQMRQKNSIQSLIGALFYFTVMRYVERGLSVLTTGKDKANEPTEPGLGHPPAELRLGHIQHHLKERPEYQAVSAIYENYYHIFERLWRRSTVHKLQRLFAQGERPRLRWLELERAQYQQN